MQLLRRILSWPRRSIQNRLTLNNSVIVLMMVITVAVLAWQINRLLGAVDTLRNAGQFVDAAVEVRQQSTELFAAVTQLLPAREGEAFLSQVPAELYDLTEAQRHLRETISASGDPAFVQRMERVDTNVTNVINIAQTMVNQVEGGRWPNAEIRMGVLNRDREEVQASVNVLVFAAESLEAEALAEVEDAQRAVVVWPATIFLYAVAATVLIFSHTLGAITKPVSLLNEGATQLAAGNLSQRVHVNSEDELGQLASTFNSMAVELQASYESLEERVAERTRALETSLEVSRGLSTILEQTELVREVVEQVREAFDYYHVHIYLMDETGEHLLMVGGTGEAGQRMLAQGHRLRAGTGLVGRAAAEKEVVLVPDVAKEPGWLPNPLLPGTRAEIAVPISFAGEVRGVLDVQHHEVGGLDSDDVHLLQLIAAQVAIALQNAHLLSEAQARAENAALANTISRRIQSATTVEAVLRVAAEELGQALQAEQAQVELNLSQARELLLPREQHSSRQALAPKSNGDAGARTGA
jgi:nitrate/nitrite-specific signal transduction histidine kinase